MANNKPLRIKTIGEFHRLVELPQPEHPLISIVDFSKLKLPVENKAMNIVFGFYAISIKRGMNNKMIYGQQKYDFDGGIMAFISPNQAFRIEAGEHPRIKRSGWILFIHPDFLWKTPLAKAINQYEYFTYSVSEALFLSEKEEETINNIIKNISQEYHSTIDKFSQGIIISQIETLLNYAERFYQRQFITRKITNHRILDGLEKLLVDYFNNDDLVIKGLPTVQFLAGTLNVSPSYLSGVLRLVTGQNTRQHIHNILIEKAKEKLSTTELSISEIAYELGFQHPQSFSKLFKTKTKLTPLEFRQSFN
jgi:AraC family transcriptional activator of pobA